MAQRQLRRVCVYRLRHPACRPLRIHQQRIIKSPAALLLHPSAPQSPWALPTPPGAALSRFVPPAHLFPHVLAPPPKALFHRPTSTEQAHATRSPSPLKARFPCHLLTISPQTRLVLFVLSGIRLHGVWPPQKSRRAQRLQAIIVSCKRLAVL